MDWGQGRQHTIRRLHSGPTPRQPRGIWKSSRREDGKRFYLVSPVKTAAIKCAEGNNGRRVREAHRRIQEVSGRGTGNADGTRQPRAWSRVHDDTLDRVLP